MREGVDETEEAGKLVTRDVGGIAMVLFRAGEHIDFLHDISVLIARAQTAVLYRKCLYTIMQK